MNRMTRITALAAAALACLALAAAAAEAPKPEAPKDEPKFLQSQWHSLYLVGAKIGYVTQGLYALPGGGHRLQTTQFLLRRLGDDKFGYYKMITADVDARFRPKALECRVVSGDHQWQVTGRVEGDEFVLARTVGASSATARIPLEEDLTFRSWALPATLLTGPTQGKTLRWLVIDESLGALLPDQYLVHVLGQRTMPTGPAGPAFTGTAIVSACGAEQVAHLADTQGRILRSVWQSTPMVAEATSLSEARRPTGSAEGPRGLDIDGLAGDHYRNPRLGLSLRVPSYPYVTHVAPETGAVTVLDLTDEASVSVRPAGWPGAAPRGGAAAAAAEDGGGPGDLLQHQWAARFDEVKAEPRPALVPGGGADRDVRAIGGTARLGCTTFHFRNLILSGEGLTWFASIAVADRPITEKPILVESVARSITPSAPQGRLPLLSRGLVLQSPYHGFEIHRPSERWTIPEHAGGPLTALEMVRDDRAAVALVRILKPRPKQSLKEFVAEQARAAADNLGVDVPEPAPATLGGQEALQIVYEGKEILGGEPARCTTIYTERNGGVLALVLVVAASADPAASTELEQVRASVKFSGPPASG